MDSIITVGGLETELVYGELYGSCVEIRVTASEIKKTRTACTKAATQRF